MSGEKRKQAYRYDRGGVWQYGALLVVRVGHFELEVVGRHVAHGYWRHEVHCVDVVDHAVAFVDHVDWRCFDESLIKTKNNRKLR